jgi:hypothetical protein
LIKASADDSPWACIVNAVLLCLLAIAPTAAAETSWVLWQNVTVTTTDLDGSNPISTTKWGPLGPAEAAKECRDRLEYIVRNGREGAIRVKDALVELNGLTTAVVRFICIPAGSDPRVPEGKMSG